MIPHHLTLIPLKSCSVAILSGLLGRQQVFCFLSNLARQPLLRSLISLTQQSTRVKQI